MVLISTHLENRYPTPTSPGSASPKDRNSKKRLHPDRKLPSTQVAKIQLTPTTPGLITENQRAFSSNANHVMTPPAVDSPTNLGIRSPMVLIPPLSAENRVSDYKTFHDDGPLIHGKKGRAEVTAVVINLDKTKDQREASDQVSNDMQTLLQDIFEADDKSTSETDVVPSTDTSPYFTWIHQEGVVFRTLAIDKLVELDLNLQKVLAAGRLGDILVDDAYRLQKLCEGSMMAVRSTELSIDTAWSLDQISAWVERAGIAETALRSARIIVKIMLGLRDEDKVSSEEILQNIVDVLNMVFTSCVAPIVEARPRDSGSEIFELASPFKKDIVQLLYQAKGVMKMLVKILDKVDIAETIITALEFFAIRILFVENAQNEKESILGIQKFESLRHTAMDIITGIFSRHAEQRSFIFDEILSSLQKLPTKGQNARQFKLSDGTSIQLVSALIIRLIQTCAIPAHSPAKEVKRRVAVRRRKSASGFSSDTDAEPKPDAVANREPSEASSDGTANDTDDGAKRRLSREANDLSDNASKNAQYVVNYFVQRAMTASKSGDQPHRHLLDMFAEDLISVLGHAEWPAAELLLNVLVSYMLNIVRVKSTAPAKNMALELLGMMGSAISELVVGTQALARNLDNQDSTRSGDLRQMFDDYVDGRLRNNEIFIRDGPYRLVLDYLASTHSDGLPTRSAQVFYLTQWARNITSIPLSVDPKENVLVEHLLDMLIKRVWNPSDSNTEPVTKAQCRLAYNLTVLQMNFCRRFGAVLNILLDSISSEQTTVRTRSLKSVTQMLEKDPSILDRAKNVKSLLIRCAVDASPMVRDSTLMLMGKCIQQKPSLEQDFFKPIYSLINDPTVSVRKRSMKLLKDLFARNKSKEVRVIVAECLLQRSGDADKGVSEMANQMLEDIWLSPFWKCSEITTDMTIQDRLALKEQMELVVSTNRSGDRVSSALVSLLRTLLASDTKSAPHNFKVCQILVSTAFESMIDPEARAEGLEQKHIVQSLTVFARADAHLFNSDQLQHLQLYITNLSNADDFGLLRSVVIIFRCVLPVVPSIQQSLLRDIQTALFKNVQKLGKTELNEVAACLWTMNGILNNPERLVKLVVSVIKHLQFYQCKNMPDQSEKDIRSARKCVQIAGAFGKHCDFEAQLPWFREALAPWQWGSVSGMIINSIKPFTSIKQPLLLRVDALHSIGLVCQSSPHQFNHMEVSDIFQQALTTGQPDVQNIVLSSFRDFFAMQENQAASKMESSLKDDPATANGKLGGSMKASEGDGASALIAQRFLRDMLSIALRSQDATALAATEVIASINRQGLVHPKESGPALVALETSSNPAIANVAFQAHGDVHQQHESMFEREYMRAIVEAYRYQKEIVQDPLGFRTPPYTSKLHSTFEIIKTSKSKYQKKFISNLCAKIGFDVDKLDLSGAVPTSLQLSRFLLENLAFFDYGRLDELLYTLTCMERIVANTGPGVAHSINTEVFQVRVDAILGKSDESGTGGEQGTSHESTATVEVTPHRLYRLTTAAIILSCVWDTRAYLRRLYGLSSNQAAREGKGNGKAKDINKAPTRTAGIGGEKFVGSIAERVASLGSQEGMFKQCSAFVELLSIDHEFRVAAEGEEEGAGRPRTPSGDEAGSPLPMSGGGGGGAGKRKRSSSVTGTPHKKRGRPSLGRRKSSRKSVEEDEEWE
ncbi:MAG: hypothetical protein Q9182_000827 [Xanthomendoza sp. 2 TL-2023]